MSMTDPIADFLTRIRNAFIAKHDRLEVPTSKIKVEISRILKERGFLVDFEEIPGEPQGTLRLFLRYTDEGAPSIQRVARVSKPGRRVYRKASELKPVLSGIGVGIISTSAGLLTLEEARDRGVGGEVICELW